MAVVGEARVIVRPVVPPSVTRDIERNFRTLDRIGVRAGGRMAASFRRGFQALGDQGTLLGNVSRGLRQIGIDGEAASRAFSNLQRFGQVLSPIFGGLIGSLGALVGGLGALAGSAGGAAASLAGLGSAGFAAVAGLGAARLALSGVGRALGLLNRQGGGGGGGGGGGAMTPARLASQTAALAAARDAALRRVQDAESSLALTVERNRESLIDANNSVREAQEALNEALKEGREEIQQIGFDAEDAALAEERAALELEDARRALAAAQDLPPNSRVRQEAELAYREAELNYRKAKDSAADLAAEQERLARTGVAGTEGVIDATKRLAEAEADRERTVRDSLRAQADAERDLADAKKDALTAGQEFDAGPDMGSIGGGGGGGGIDPFAGLNQAQIDFVKNLQTLKPELEELKRVTAEALLPNLWEAIKIIMDDTGKVFPVLRDGLEGVAFASGLAALSLARSVEEAENLADLAGAFTQSAPLIESFGRVMAEAWGVAITLINEAFPIAQRFFDFLGDRLSTFDDWMNTVEGRSALQDFFQRSSDAMAQWGEVFGNILQGFGATINANLGPGTGGQLMLDWLIESTNKFAELEKTAGGASALNDYFLGAAANTKAMFQSIGALIGEIIALGDMPQIAETWDILREGADDVGRTLAEMIKVGPAFAEVVKILAEIVDLMIDAETGIAFFATIEAILRPLRDFLANEMVQAFLEWLAPITGVALAIGGILLAFQIAIPIIFGYLSRLIGVFQALWGIVAANPIILVVAGVVAAIVYLWNTSETFVDSMMAIFGDLSSTFMETFSVIASTVMGVLPPLMALLSQAFLAIMPAIEVVLVGLAQAFSTIIQAVLPLVATLVSTLLPTITAIIQAVMPLVVLLIQQLAPVIASLAQLVAGVLAQGLGLITTLFNDVVGAILPLVVVLIEQLVPVIMDIVSAVIPPLMEIINLLIPIILNLIETFMPLFTTLMDLIVPVVIMLFNAITPLISQVADLLIPIIEVVTEVFMALLPPIMELVQAVIDALMPVFKGIIDIVKGFVIPIIQFLVDVFKNFLIPIIMNVVSSISSFLIPIIRGIIDILSNVIGFLTNVFKGNWEGVWNSLIGIVRGVANTIISIVEGMINFVIDGINGFLGALNSAGDFISDVTGGAIDINVGKIGRVRIPRLAEGGTVKATPGGIMAVIGEAGRNERVEPLDKDGLSKRDHAMIEKLIAQNGGGGVQITVVQNPGENMEAFAQRVSEIIAQKMRRGMAY